jgi:hypothetical protein
VYECDLPLDEHGQVSVEKTYDLVARMEQQREEGEISDTLRLTDRNNNINSNNNNNNNNSKCSNITTNNSTAASSNTSPTPSSSSTQPRPTDWGRSFHYNAKLGQWLNEQRKGMF